MVDQVHTVLEHFCRASESGDFEGFARRCCTPYASVRDTETVIFKNHAALQTLFEKNRAAIRAMRDMRFGYEILAITPHGGRLLSTTAILSGYAAGRLIVDPVTLVMILRMEEDEWRLAAVINPLMARVNQYLQEQGAG
ncbi:MAG: hypothetical protein AAFR46_03720 [Pseudomonadota bacterium]